MISQDLPQGKVEDVGEGVVGDDLPSPLVVHLDSHSVTHRDAAGAAGVCSVDHMQDIPRSDLAIRNVQDGTGAADNTASVTNLQGSRENFSAEPSAATITEQVSIEQQLVMWRHSNFKGSTSISSISRRIAFE